MLHSGLYTNLLSKPHAHTYNNSLDDDFESHERNVYDRDHVSDSLLIFCLQFWPFISFLMSFLQ